MFGDTYLIAAMLFFLMADNRTGNTAKTLNVVGIVLATIGICSTLL